MTGNDPIQQTYDPPRFRWTRRIVLGACVLVVLIPALWASATYIAQHRLDSLIASYRAAGEPVLAEDFNTHRDIPDEENAAAYYEKADSAYIWPAKFSYDFRESDLLESLFGADAGTHMGEAEHVINTNGATFEHLQQAAKCVDAEWGFTFAQPMIDTAYDDVWPTRRQGKLLSIAALHAHANGGDGHAINLLSIQLALAKHRAAVRRSSLDHLVASSISELSCAVIQGIGAELSVAPEAGAPEENVALRRGVQKLIADLLDDHAFADSLAFTTISERAFMIDTIRFLGTGKPIPAILPSASRLHVALIRPLLITDSRRFVEHFAQIVVACRQPTYPWVMSEYPDPPTVVIGRGLGDRLPDFIRQPSYESLIQVEFTRQARRRMAAISLAIRLFEIDHGLRPDELAQLVPDYLAAVPRDPFARGDAPIQYLPGFQPPVLYSVGSTGIEYADEAAFEANGMHHLDTDGLVFYLNGERLQPNP